jgi:hypothetical protein
MKIRLIAIILLLVAGGLKAATINSASASRSDVGAAVSTAVNGDTVLLPAGQSATWTSELSFTKGITLDLNGCTITRNISTNARVIVATGVNGFTTRITGGTFSGGSTGTGFNARYIRVNSTATGPVRVDHCVFNDSGGSSIMFETYHTTGQVLLDHCTFNANSVCEIIHNNGYGAGQTGGWAVDVTPGSLDAFYIEDCTFNKLFAGSAGALHAIANGYGSRTVFRHNVVDNMDFDNHGTAGAVGGRWFEVYDNQWFSDAGLAKVFQIRGGSGVIFNNTLTNLPGASGSRSTNLWEEDSGAYPELYQVGRGKNQALDPLYINNNTVIDSGGGTGGMQIELQGPNVANLIQVNRDYFIGTRPSYTAAAYPHDLQGAAAAPVLSSAAVDVNGTTVTLTFNQLIKIGAGGNGGWTISMSGGAVTLGSPSDPGSGSATVTFTPSRTIVIGETGTVSYTQPGNGFENTDAVDLATLSGFTVSNASGSGQVATPTFDLASGPYFGTQSVAIDTTTSGDTIHYTTDGSLPDSGDTQYSAPVSITTNSILKAIGIKSGLVDSMIASSAYDVISWTSDFSWKTFTTPQQTGTFIWVFSATPLSTDVDCVIGLAPGPVSTWTHMAAIVLFNISGAIQVRDGAGYSAENVVNYSAGTTYDFVVTINVPSKTYSVTVTPQGSSAVVLATDFDFRSEQSSATELDNLGTLSQEAQTIISNMSFGGVGAANSGFRKIGRHSRRTP